MSTLLKENNYDHCKSLLPQIPVMSKHSWGQKNPPLCGLSLSPLYPGRSLRWNKGFSFFRCHIAQRVGKTGSPLAAHRKTWRDIKDIRKKASQFIRFYTTIIFHGWNNVSSANSIYKLKLNFWKCHVHHWYFVSRRNFWTSYSIKYIF